MFIDTHCHLDFHKFDEDRDEVVERMLAAGILQAIVPALSPSNWQSVIDLAEKYEPLFAAVGVHPNDSAGWQDGWLNDLRDLAAHPKVVAIGEIGLDYYWDKSPKKIQQRAFGLQLELAAELEMPAIIHNRNSNDDLLQMLHDSPLTKNNQPGVLHSFSADLGFAEAALKLGYYLGFTGPVTFKKAAELREVVCSVPADKILLETDAPFLAPHPKRGQRNEPAYIPLIASRIASERGCDIHDLAQQTTKNAHRLFPKLVRV